MDTHSYKGWLNSDNFFKRAFGIFFYYFVANALIGIIFFILVGIPAIIMFYAINKPIYDKIDSYKTEEPANIQNFK